MLYWTVVDVRSHTAHESYTFRNEHEARAAFNNMVKAALAHKQVRAAHLYNDKGVLVASNSLTFFGD